MRRSFVYVLIQFYEANHPMKSKYFITRNELHISVNKRTSNTKNHFLPTLGKLIKNRIRWFYLHTRFWNPYVCALMMAENACA